MIVLDTHAWLWWVSQPANLSKVAVREIRAAPHIGVSAISCLEVATLVAKGRIALDRDPLSWLQEALALPRVELLPLSPAVCVKATQLGRGFHGDPADRIIVASALIESARLVTKDLQIRAYDLVDSVW